jgi:broad specificity phosphatase PhoE
MILMLRPQYLQWVSGNYEARSPGGGESLLEVQARQKDALSLLLSQCKDGQVVVVVSHSSYLRLMLSTVLGWPLYRSKMQPMQVIQVYSRPCDCFVPVLVLQL